MKRRLLNIAIAFDQLAWVLLTLGNGLPDETISAAAWRMESQGKLAGRLFRPVVDALFFFDQNHCLHVAKKRDEAMAATEAAAQAPAA